MRIEMRWFKSVDDSPFILQFRQEEEDEAGIWWGEWKDIPYILEGSAYTDDLRY